MSRKRGVELKFYAALPVDEDENYRNGFDCDYCGTPYLRGPFFHCPATGTDCCLQCAADPGTPAKRHLKPSELLKSQQRASETPRKAAASQSRGKAGAVIEKVEVKRESSSQRSAPPTASAAALPAVTRPVKNEEDADTEKDSLLSTSAPISRLFFPPASAFASAEKDARNGNALPLLGFACESNVLGVVLTDGRNVLVAPAAGVGWLVQPALTASADALHLTIQRGKRGRGNAPQGGARSGTSGMSDNVERVTLAHIDAQFPWLMECFGARSWRRAEHENAGVAPPQPASRFKRRVALTITKTGATVPTYLRWCSLVRELEITGLKGLPQGSLSGRIATLLSDGTAQLIDFARGVNFVMPPGGTASGAAAKGAADDDRATAVLADLVNALV